MVTEIAFKRRNRMSATTWASTSNQVAYKGDNDKIIYLKLGEDRVMSFYGARELNEANLIKLLGHESLHYVIGDVESIEASFALDTMDGNSAIENSDYSGISKDIIASITEGLNR